MRQIESTMFGYLYNGDTMESLKNPLLENLIGCGCRPNRHHSMNRGQHTTCEHSGLDCLSMAVPVSVNKKSITMDSDHLGR